MIHLKTPCVLVWLFLLWSHKKLIVALQTAFAAVHIIYSNYYYLGYTTICVVLCKMCLLTIQNEVCVRAPQLVGGDTGVITIISVRHVKESQFRQ